MCWKLGGEGGRAGGRQALVTPGGRAAAAQGKKGMRVPQRNKNSL